MKKLFPRAFPRIAVVALFAASVLVGSSHLSFAASASWIATPSNNLWEPGIGNTNWSTGANTFPGNISGVSSTDIATFNIASSITSITINNATFPAARLNIRGITFTGTPSNYIIGSTSGQGIFLTSGGSIQMTSALANNAVETVNEPLFFGNPARYTFANNSAAGTLNIGGNIAQPIILTGSVALTLTGSNTNANTISGSIFNGALGVTSITKTGFGTWVLSGNNTFTGGVFIDNGTLQVASFNALGAGDTTIVGIRPNFGVLETFGSNPIFFHVGNNFNILGGLPFNILQMKVGGLVPGFTSDHMSVGNNANLAGELFVHKINNFTPGPGDEVQIISTTGTRNGTFQSVQSDFPGLIQPIAVYFPQAVDVRFVLASTFLSQAITFNQQQVANALDDAFAMVCLTPTQLAAVGNIPMAFLPAAYDLIAPEEFGAIYEMSFSRAQVQSSNLQHRMDQIRFNGDPNCGPIVEINPAPEGKNVKEVMPPAPAPEARFDTFAIGSGQYVAVHDQDENAQGYRITNGSFLAGADYRFLHNFGIGLYGGYNGSEANLVHHGYINSDGGTIGGFATFFTRGFYLQGSGGAGWNSYNMHRGALGIGTVRARGAQSSTDGSEVNAMGAVGYDWSMTFNAANHPGSLTVGPIISVQYTNLDIDEFSETGSLIPLHFPDQSQDSFRGEFGGKLAICIETDHNIMLRPDVRVFYLHEFNDNEFYDIDANFIGCPTVFTVRSPRIGDDAVAVNAGLAVQFGPTFTLFGHYDGIFGRDNYRSQAVSGGIGLSF